jgi:hypothetical protein
LIGHTLRKDDGEISKAGTLREAGREEDQKIVGKDRLSKKWGEVEMK